MGIHVKQACIKVRQIMCLHEAVKHGSLSKAAEKNSMKQSNFSTYIKQLEEEFGEKLLLRVHNGIALTETGKEVYAYSCDLSNLLMRVNAQKIKSFKIAGEIRVWTSDGLGLGLLSKCIPDFTLGYPNVTVDITCDLDMPQFNEFDMALLYEKPENINLKIVGEYDLNFGLFASKGYLERYGYPKSVKDIQENHLICNRCNYAGVWKKWENILSNAKSVTTTTNSSSMLLQMVKDGIGLGLLPISTASQETDLIHLSKVNLHLSHKLWMVVRKDVLNVDKIKALLQFIKNATEKL